MESLFAGPFRILEIPNIRIKKPTWIKTPSAMVVFSIVLLTYFLATGGTIYNLVQAPGSHGWRTDEHGKQVPQAFWPSVKNQYSMEGVAAGFLSTLGGIGFIMLSFTHNPAWTKTNRLIVIAVAFVCILFSVILTHIFALYKVPWYLKSFYDHSHSM